MKELFEIYSTGMHLILTSETYEMAEAWEHFFCDAIESWYISGDITRSTKRYIRKKYRRARRSIDFMYQKSFMRGSGRVI